MMQWIMQKINKLQILIKLDQKLIYIAKTRIGNSEEIIKILNDLYVVEKISEWLWLYLIITVLLMTQNSVNYLNYINRDLIT